MKQEKKFDYTLVGGATTVRVFKFQNMPQVGQTEQAVNTNADEVFYGGCGYNVFRGMLALGSRPLPVITYEDPQFTPRLGADCAAHGLPADGLFGPKRACYYSCIMLQDAARNHITMTYWYGQDADGNAGWTQPRMQDAFFEDSGGVILVVGAPGTTEATLEMVRKHRLPLYYSYRNDPLLVPQPLLRDILSEVTVLFCNEQEAAHICKLCGLTDLSVLLTKAKAKAVVTTLGKRGAVIHTTHPQGGINEMFIPVTENEIGNVDAVGSGDAFVAGFMHGYAQGLPLQTCAQYGSTVASFVIEKDGSTTNLPSFEDMLKRNNTRPDAAMR